MCKRWGRKIVGTGIYRMRGLTGLMVWNPDLWD
jgi:hypothetical protein